MRLRRREDWSEYREQTTLYAKSHEHFTLVSCAEKSTSSAKKSEHAGRRSAKWGDGRHTNAGYGAQIRSARAIFAALLLSSRTAAQRKKRNDVPHDHHVLQALTMMLKLIGQRARMRDRKSVEKAEETHTPARRATQIGPALPRSTARMSAERRATFAQCSEQHK